MLSIASTSRSLTRAGRRIAPSQLRTTTAAANHDPSLVVSVVVNSKNRTIHNFGGAVNDGRFFVHTDLSRREEDEKRRRSNALYSSHANLPRISVVAAVPQLFQTTTTTALRWKSTAAAAATPTSKVVGSVGDSPVGESSSAAAAAASSSSSETTDPLGGGSSADATMRDKLRARLQDGKDRAGGYRDSAATHLRDFREHPRESAKEGAKTVSAMFQKYGPVFVGTYLSVYFGTLGLLFGGVQSGVLDPVVLFGWLGQEGALADGSTETASTVHLVVEFMENHDFTKPYAGYIEQNPAFANLAVAWIAVKFTEPIRLGVALTITPRVSRFLGYTKEEDVTTTSASSASASAASACPIATTTTTTDAAASPEFTKDDGTAAPPAASAGTKPKAL